LNPRAVARFKTLQQGVTLARIARERRHIRTNLPLKDVVVIAAKEEDVEALNYLKTYFVSEINAWNVTMSTDWEHLCALKVQPNWKDLGKRLGKKMKDVAKAINELAYSEITDFMKSGVIEICGFSLTKEDIVVKREFNGDAKKYEACVSEDGGLMIAIDTTCDDEVMHELRSRVVTSVVQKLRKSSGLVVGDKVEIFYEVEGADEAETAATYALISESLSRHSEAVLTRLKMMPMALKYKSSAALTVAKESVKDMDICKGTFNLYLTLPALSLDTDALLAVVGGDAAQLSTVVAYLQTVDYSRALSVESLQVGVEGHSYSFSNGVHYFPSAATRLGK